MRFLPLLFLPLLPLPALAADQDRIDKVLDACLAMPEGASTPGMVDCTDEAIQAWDKRLNEVYKRVMADFDPKSRECCAPLSADGWHFAKPSTMPWEGRGDRTGLRSSAC